MRIVALSLLVLWTLTLAGCQSKAAKVKQLVGQQHDVRCMTTIERGKREAGLIKLQAITRGLDVPTS